jgi:hypothetical protein
MIPKTTCLGFVGAWMMGCGLAAHVEPARADSPKPRPELLAGQSAITNDLLVQCLGDQVRVAPAQASVDGASPSYQSNGRTYPVYESHGPLQSSYADCRLEDGTTVRVKSGKQFEPMAYGQCGAAPGEKLSVWIDRRKVLSSFGYAGRCEDMLIKSLAIRRSRATVCVPPVDSESVQADDFADLRAAGLDKEGCIDLPLAHPTHIDAREFSVDGHMSPPVGSLTLEALPAMRAVCMQLLKADREQDPEVDDKQPQPSWQKLHVASKQPNLEHLGFNATTLSALGAVDVANFDLENTGSSHRIYMLDSSNHWFDGSALAIDSEGVLTVPFDAHNEPASLREGIHVWVYDHAQVFFDHGHTYILLNPVNHEQDSRVVMLHGDRQETVCTFHRSQDNF